MPIADFTNDYSSNAGRSNFPRLRLQTGEYARIAIVSQPAVEYTHWLEAPNIVNMAPTYKKVKDRDNNEQWVVETRRVNNVICLGNYEILKERGVDDHGCQACLYSRERPDIFRPPTTRFAANVIRYGMRPGGGWSDIAQPYGIGTLIWVFGGKVMDKLILIKTMGPGYEDLRAVDLLLSCEDQNFQKPYSSGDFNAIIPAAWMSDDARRQHTIQYLQQNSASPSDLSDAIAKRVKEDWLGDDLLRVIQRWDVVRAYEARQQGGPVLGSGFGAESLQQGMANVQQQFGQPQGGFSAGGGAGGGGAGGGGAGGGWTPGGNGQSTSFGGSGGAGSSWTPNQAAGSNGTAVGGGGAAGSGFQPQSVGVDTSLLGGQPSTQQASGVGVDFGLLQAQQNAAAQPSAFTQAAAAELAQNQIPNPVADAFAQFQAQQAAAATPPPPPAQSASPPAAQGPVPDGLAGLADFMASQAGAAASSPPPPPPAPAAEHATPPAGGHYTFEDLAKLGKQ